jgi:hypothetical protein
MTEPLATNDRVIVQLGGEAEVLEISDRTLQEVARSVNLKDSEVILSTNTTTVLNGKKVIYDTTAQKAYGLPALPTNVYISSVADGKLTYNPGGVVVDLLPVPGSVASLASNTGASQIGTANGMTVQEILDLGYFLIADRTGATDVSAVIATADAYSVANDVVIQVQPGLYTCKNLVLAGSWKFDEGAVFSGLLGERDNIVVAASGARLINPQFRKELSAWPTDGDYGNALKLGAYRQPSNGTNTHDIYVENFYCLSIGTTFTSQSIEVLGDVRDSEINGAIFEGPGAGIICHWGGDVGDAGAHDSMVTYSYHPHNIKLSNFMFRADSLGNAPSNTMIISSCYNMDISNVSSYGVDRTLWVFPGDVYNEVAVARDKYKVCTGIKIDGVYINDPVDNNAAIDLGGIPATKRTVNTTYYSRDRGSNASMDITLTGANIACRDVVYANPNVLIRSCKNVKASINKTGGEHSTTYWAYLDYNESCEFLLSGTAIPGERLRGNTNCQVTLNSTRDTSAYSSSDSGCEIYSFISASCTFNAASAGATTVTVTSAIAGILFSGSKIYINNVVVGTVIKSVLVPASTATTVTVTPLSVAIAASATGVFVLTHEGTTILGTKQGFLYNYRVHNGWGLTFRVNSKNAARGAILFSGEYLYGCDVFDSTFAGTGQENGGPGRWDINVSATKIRGFRWKNCKMDVDAVNPVISARLNLTSLDHSGVVIADNISTITSSGVSYALANSTVASAGNMQQIYGNVTGGENVCPLTTVEGQYMGTMYYGYARNSVAPTTGYFIAGSKLHKQTFSVGVTSELVCTASGAPGTWAATGTVS